MTEIYFCAFCRKVVEFGVAGGQDNLKRYCNEGCKLALKRDRRVKYEKYGKKTD